MLNSIAHFFLISRVGKQISELKPSLGLPRLFQWFISYL